MYILSDYFIGNVKNSKQSYLEGNTFKYTNNGKEYRTTVIDIKDIHKGTLSQFYSYITIHEWISEETLSLIDNKVTLAVINGQEALIAYISVDIDIDNNVTGIYAIDKEEVKGKKVVAPNEEIVPKVSSQVTVFRDKEKGMHLTKVEGDTNDIDGQIYYCFFCLPSMKLHEKIHQYVFNTQTTFSYGSN